jgi:hypothetical protein
VAEKGQRGPRRFGGAWAKAEIFLGLTAAGVGLFGGVWQVSRPAGELDWSITAAALALWVLGGYLALAGQRSHLYRSNIELAASLREELRRLQEQG